ncbi:acyl carrier protein [bacterium]|nr:acyl carrier protein [bacterium]
MEETLYRQAKQLVCETLEISVEELEDSTHFVNDLGIDSILIIELKTRFEEIYHIEINKEELKDLNCLADIIKYLAEKSVLAV